MTIYYLNSYDWSDEIIEKIIPGDFCILQSNNYLYFCIINKRSLELIKSGIVSSIFSCVCTDVLLPSSKILYRFNGVNHRSGNIDTFQKIKALQLCPELLHFIEDIIMVLNYKEDKVSVTSLYALYSLKESEVAFKIIYRNKKSQQCTCSCENKAQVIVNKPQSACQNKEDNLDLDMPTIIKIPPERYLFYHYVPTEFQETWNELYDQGMEIRDIFVWLKAKNKTSFNLILKKYKMLNPDKNIYSITE